MTRLLSDDEAYSWRIIQYPFQEILERAGGDANPPLSYLLQKLWSELASDSILSLRLFSLLLYILAVILAVVCLRQCKRSGLISSHWLNDSFLTGILFIHPLLFHQALTARMYALGLLLTGLTSLLLLKSLTAVDKLPGWLMAYGIAAAAFAWTHYYAFFTLTGQVVFAGAFLSCRAWQGEHAAVGHWLTAACWGAALAIVLFAPCLPVFLAQRRDVQEGFWIADPAWSTIRGILVPCLTGMPDAQISLLVIAPWILCIAILIYYADWIAWFFLAQAALPWFLGIAYSLATGRSILYDRYFSFATYAWFCFVGVSWARLPMGFLKGITAIIIGGLLLGGFVEEINSGPSAQAQEEAAAFLRDNYREGDVCWADWAPEVNTLRYYLAQAGLPEANVRCHFSLNLGSGHIVHQGSLSADDLFWGDFPEGKRIWRCAPLQFLTVPTPPGMAESQRRTFEGPNKTFYSVILLEPAKS